MSIEGLPSTEPVVFQALFVEFAGPAEARRIAKGLGVASTTVRSWSLGYTVPRHQYGEALIREWCRRTGRTRDEVPTK